MLSNSLREALGLTYTNALGMWVLNRGHDSCKWRTPACADCYNHRLSNAYKDTCRAWKSPEGSDNLRWNRCTRQAFEDLPRVRLCSRGEAFPDLFSVFRVAEWAEHNPRTLFWIPTRSWQVGCNLNYRMIKNIDNLLRPLPNVRVMASLDPFTAHHYAWLRSNGWSTMYFESYNAPEWYNKGEFPSAVATPFKCPKTWDIYKDPNTGRIVAPHGVCRTCESGCFSTNRVDVWLRNHSKPARLSDLPAGQK